jgi:hypothetical protein
LFDPTIAMDQLALNVDDGQAVYPIVAANMPPTSLDEEGYVVPQLNPYVYQTSAIEPVSLSLVTRFIRRPVAASFVRAAHPVKRQSPALPTHHSHVFYFRNAATGLGGP